MKKNNIKKWISLFLCLLMLVNTGYFISGSNLKASEEAAEYETNQEQGEEIDVENSDEQSSSSESASGSSDSSGNSSDSSTSGSSKSSSSVDVSATGISGSLTAEKVDDSDKLASYKEKLGREIVSAYDITADGSVTDAEDGARVVLSAGSISDVSTTGLYHITGGSYEKIDYSYDGDAGTITFNTDSFSPFVLAKMTSDEISADQTNNDSSEDKNTSSDENNDEDNASENTDESSAGELTASEEKKIIRRAQRRLGISLSSSSSSNLEDFLKNVTFDNVQKNADGTYSPVEGERYKIHLEFAEKPNGLQFADTGKLRYTLPNGFKPVAKDNGTFSIDVTTGDGNYTVTGNTYTVNEDGTITVEWNQGTDDTSRQNYEELTSCGNAEFSLDIYGEFTADAEEIKFSDEISKSVKVDDETDVEIWKSVQEKNGRYFYTVNVRGSKGTSTNVKVTDTLGYNSLLSIDTGTLEVSTDPSGIDCRKIYSDSTGFSYTIPELKKNENVQFTYYADMRSGYNYTADQIKNLTTNTAYVTADGKTHEASQSLSYLINKEQLDKSHTMVQDSDRYIINWRIDYSRGDYVDPSGITLRDTLDGYGITQYDGYGITVFVYDEYGRYITRRDIAWEDLDKDYYGWKYTIPERDRTGYKYIITYQTSVKKSDVHADISLRNKIEDGTSSSEDSAKLSPGVEDSIGVRKTVQDVTYNKVKWRIVLKVPAEGLDSANLVDYLPSKWLNGENLSDDLVMPDGDVSSAFNITGLRSGESYKADIQTNNGSKYVYLNFYKNGKDGLMPSGTGNSRAIVITYETKNNEKWLKAAEDNTWYLTHDNTVYFGTDGQWEGDTAQATPSRKSIEKTWVKNRDTHYYADNYWDQLPMYCFQIDIKGMKADGSNSGDLVVTDDFDKSLLKYQEYNSRWNKLWNAGKVYASDDPWNFQEICDAQVEDTDTGLKFTAPKSSITKSDGSYYNNYRITYYLSIKDAETYKKVYEKALKNTDGSGTFTMSNKADFEGITSEADVSYDSQVLKKSITNEKFQVGSDYYAEFEVNFNPAGADLDPNSDTLNLTDITSNLQIDPTSIKVEQGSGVVLNTSADGKKIVGKVPDGQHVRIKYRARILGTNDVNYSNKITIYNYSKSTSKKVNVGSNGAGTASNPALTLIKTKEGTVTDTLKGAQFHIYTMDGGNKEYLRDGSGSPVIYTTDSNGSVVIQGNQKNYGWTLEEGKEYYLEEYKAPEGYKKANDKKFIITSSWNKTDEADTYFKNSRLIISDKPEGAEINVSKKVLGDSTDKSRSFDFVIQAQDENGLPLTGAYDAVVKDSEGTALAKNIVFNGGKAVFSLKDGETLTVTVPDKTQYAVSETSSDSSYRTESVDAAGSASKDSDASAVFTNIAKTSVSGTKTWVGVSEENAPDAVIDLYRSGEKVDSVTLKNGASSYSFDGLDKYDSNGKLYSYTVKEEPLAGYTSEQDGNNFTNTKRNDKISVSGTKTWKVSDGTTVPDVTIDLYQNGKKIDSTVIKGGTDKKSAYSFNDLDKYDADGDEYEYTVKEEPVEGYSSEQDGYDFANTRSETTDISGTKTWITPDPDNVPSITIDLIRTDADGSEKKVDSRTLVKGETSYVFTDVPKFDSDGQPYSYHVEEEAVAGFTSSVAGSSFTNTIEQGKTSISGTKTWITPDKNNVPDVTIDLLRDGTKVDSVTLKAGETSYSFTDLDRYDLTTGQEYEYTVIEESVDGYTSEQDGNNFTNTIEQDKTSVSGTKTWVVPKGTKVPDVTIDLYRDGTKVDSTVIRSGDDSYKFDNLDKYDLTDGHEYKYTVKEAVPDGYTSKQDGNDFINTIEQEKTSVSGTKTWIVPDGTTVPDVTIDLLRDGEKVGSIDLKDGETDYSFTDLDKYDLKDGHEYKYTVAEEHVDGYTSEQDGNNFTNTIAQKKISVSGTKTWKVPKGTSVPDITIRLMRDDKELKSVTLTNGDTDYSFDDLDKYDLTDGHEYKYTVQEDEVKGYTSRQDGYNFTNTIDQEKISVKGTKTWKVPDGTTVPDVTIELYRDGGDEAYKTTTIKSGESGYEFKDLDRYDLTDGHEYKYTVKESVPGGYTSEQDGNDFTNIIKQEKTSISGTKTWIIPDGTKVPDVTIELYRDGGDKAYKTTMIKSGQKTYSFDDLDKYDLSDGHKYEYTVKEVVPEGYTSEQDGRNFTNTIKQEKTKVSGSKTWIVPEGTTVPDVTIELYRDGGDKAYKTTMIKSGESGYEFKDLDKYDLTDGHEYKYTVKEVVPGGYTSEQDGNDFTNIIKQEKTSVSGTKTWKVPEGTKVPDVTIKLYRDDEEKAFKTTTIESGQKRYSFSGLDKYDLSDGHEYKYTVKEVVPDGYTSEKDGYDFTNTIEQAETSVSGTKTWIVPEDTSVPDVTIELYRDGEKVESTVIKSGDKNYKFDDLDKYDLTDGHEYKYTVKEVVPEGYTSEQDGNDFTNTIKQQSTSVSGTKTWIAPDDTKLPDVTIELYRDGGDSPYKTTVIKNGETSYEFSDLDKYDLKDGHKYEYTVKEVVPAGYTSIKDGTDFTNISKKTTSVSGTKTWIDPEGTTHPEITIDLYRDGEKFKTTTLKNGETKYSFDGLEIYDQKDGHKYEYTVKEEAVDGYTSKQDGLDFTNTINQKNISVSGTKTWIDDEDRDGIRPISIEVSLFADGIFKQTTEVSEASGWSYRFADLPKYAEDGHIISYTVQESGAEGYSLDDDSLTNKAAEGSDDFVYDLRNRYTPEKTSVSVTKSWIDGDDKDGLRPDSIKVQLYDVTEGEDSAAAVGEPVTLSSDNNWTYTWTDLSRKKNKGTEIKYSVKELEVPAGYEASTEGAQETGFTITNKEIDTSVSASKEWVNADNTRTAPEDAEAAFRLYKNGEATDETITLDGTADENGEKKAWTAEFDDLAKFDRNGDKIDYTIKETSAADGYKAESTEAVSDGGVITNRQINAGAVIRGTKRMAGSAELKAGSYRFYLKDASGNIVDTAKNDADGTFTFAKIVFTEPGSKSYTISEQHAGEMINGIKYDDSEYPVTVTAEKDGDGLKTSVSYPSGSPVFTNRAVRNLTVKKVWNDDNDKNGMRPDSVIVDLMNDGKVVDTAELSEGNNWSFTFEGLDPDKDYTVSEVLAEDSGYSCDISYDGDTVTLTNEFVKTVDITASKTLKGATIKSGEFTFKLERKSGGDPIYAVNDSEGQITFKNVPYDKEGYVVTEEAGSESGITYDKDSITYDADGNVTSEKKSFTNTKKTTEKKSEQDTPAVLRVQKTSKEEPHDPLEGAKYGLYRYVEGGNDILVEAETSDENGYMYYDKVEEGVIYYFKEISAPSGHEVDPYAGEKFMIRYDSNGQPYTCDADGNRTDIGDITRQDSSKAYVQVKKSTVDLGSIAYNESTQTLYENTADNGIKAAAIASDAAFPEGTVLKITEKKLSSKAEQNLEKKAGKVNSIVYYDVAFEKDGKEIEPDAGSVKVVIQDSQSLSGAVASGLKIIHLLDDDAEAIEPLKGSVTAASGNLVQMTFMADSFSTIGVVEPEDSTTFGSNYMITSAGVSDQVSELNVAKVDSKGDYVKGAKMQIFEKSSGKVVAEWTTGDGLKEFSRWFDKAQTEPMNVDTYYVLHEVSAPEGYTLADDIVFRINKYDSSITIYKFDDEGQLVEDKDAEEKWVSDTRLTMVDIPKKVVTSRRYKTRYVVRKHTVKVHGANEITREIVRTGDESQLPLLVTIMLASAAAVIVILIIRKRRGEKE